MHSKPLQYETSKIVMMYLNPNTRFKISQQAMALRSIEKLVPLRMKEFTIGDYYCRVNDTEHTNSEERNFQIYGTRKSAIQVQFLTITSKKRDCTNGMPNGVQIHTRNLKLLSFQNQNLKAISGILTPESLPLDTVECTIFHQDFGNSSHAIVRDAKHFIIGQFWSPPAWLSTFRSLKNQISQVKEENLLIGVEEYIELIEHWLEHGKASGTCYSFGMAPTDIQEVLKSVRKRPEVIEKSKRSSTLAMKSGFKLIVSYDGRFNARYCSTALELKVI